MVTAEMYKNYLSSYGSNLAQVKKNQSDAIMNNSFTADAQYKRVYILTKDGWKWEDAKYQRHAKLSILKDAVDYYLQFRPKVHYPIGSYVFVPDDTSILTYLGTNLIIRSHFQTKELHNCGLLSVEMMRMLLLDIIY